MYELRVYVHMYMLYMYIYSENDIVVHMLEINSEKNTRIAEWQIKVNPFIYSDRYYSPDGPNTVLSIILIRL